MKSFLFLYPIPVYINFEIDEKGFFEDKKEFRRRYKEALNKCIDLRYRQKGFEISYVNFRDHEISDVVELRPDDNVIEVGYSYPDPDFVLDKLNGVQVLRVGGFHLWYCVEKIAKRAYERGLDVLVDEDLTELLTYRVLLGDFEFDKFPTPYHGDEHGLEIVRERRKGKPWMWQYQ